MSSFSLLFILFFELGNQWYDNVTTSERNSVQIRSIPKIRIHKGRSCLPSLTKYYKHFSHSFVHLVYTALLHSSFMIAIFVDFVFFIHYSVVFRNERLHTQNSKSVNGSISPSFAYTGNISIISTRKLSMNLFYEQDFMRFKFERLQ